MSRGMCGEKEREEEEKMKERGEANWEQEIRVREQRKMGGILEEEGRGRQEVRTRGWREERKMEESKIWERREKAGRRY